MARLGVGTTPATLSPEVEPPAVRSPSVSPAAASEYPFENRLATGLPFIQNPPSLLPELGGVSVSLKNSSLFLGVPNGSSLS